MSTAKLPPYRPLPEKPEEIEHGPSAVLSFVTRWAEHNPIEWMDTGDDLLVVIDECDAWVSLEEYHGQFTLSFDVGFPNSELLHLFHMDISREEADKLGWFTPSFHVKSSLQVKKGGRR